MNRAIALALRCTRELPFGLRALAVSKPASRSRA
jgi:hypothetical protein